MNDHVLSSEKYVPTEIGPFWLPLSIGKETDEDLQQEGRE